MDNVGQVLSALLKDSSASVSNKLIEINRICKEQLERGSSDYSIATIGRIAESENVLKTQTIRNKTGEKYKTLIDAWAKSYSVPQQKKLTEHSSWIDQIPDAQTKWLVRDMQNELTRLRGEVNLLKSVDRNIYINTGKALPKKPEESTGVLSILSTPDYEALVNGISDENIESSGLIKGELGEIKNSDGINVMPFGFITAIEKIISISGENDD